MWAWLAMVVVITSVVYFGIMWLTSRHDRGLDDGMFDWKE